MEKAAKEAREAFEGLEKGYNKQREDDRLEIEKLKKEVARLTKDEESARKELLRVDRAVRGRFCVVVCRLFCLGCLVGMTWSSCRFLSGCRRGGEEEPSGGSRGGAD